MCSSFLLSIFGIILIVMGHEEFSERNERILSRNIRMNSRTKNSDSDFSDAYLEYMKKKSLERDI